MPKLNLEGAQVAPKSGVGSGDWIMPTSTETDKTYLKVGSVPKPTAPAAPTGPSVVDQANSMKASVDGRTMTDIYSAMVKTKPTDMELVATIGKSTGLTDRITGVQAQMQDIRRSMMGDQSGIFSARNPDGTEMDPRVKVAAFQSSMNSYMQRIDQLTTLESAYKAEMKTLADYETKRMDAENEKNKVALNYLQTMSDQKNKADQFQMEKDKFAFQKSTDARDFNEKQREFDATLGKPVASTDPNTGATIWNTPPTGDGMRTDRHSNPTAFTTQIAKQAGLKEGVDYTEGDPFGKNGEYKTAKLLGDPIATTIKVIDKIGFNTQTGATRWSYTDKIGLNNETWAKMNTEQKSKAIGEMYKQEGGSGSLMKGGTKVNPDGSTTSSNGTTTQDLVKLGMSKEIALALDKQDLMAIKGASPEEKTAAIKDLMTRYKQDPAYFQNMRVQNIKEYLTQEGYASDKIKELTGIALQKGYSILQVEQKYAKDTAADGKKKPIEDYVGSLDVSKIQSYDDIYSLADEINQKYPDMNQDDKKDKDGNITKPGIITYIENRIGNKRLQELLDNQDKSGFGKDEKGNFSAAHLTLQDLF